MIETSIITSFKEFNLNEFMLPIIVVYEHPIDFPTKYVARLFDLNVCTPYAVVADKLEELQAIIPFEFTKLNRMENDDPVIIELWI